MVSIAASAAAQATGLPPYVPPRPPTCGGVHDLGAAGDGGERQAAGDALGGDDEVGHDALVLAGEHGAGAGEPGLHLVGDEDDAVRARTTPAARARKPSAGTMKPPSPWIGSMMSAARLAAPICFSIIVDRALRGRSPSVAVLPNSRRGTGSDSGAR